MDFGKLYETIFLRDFLEYFVPGFIFLVGIGVIINIVNIPIESINTLKDSSFFSFSVVLFSYVFGHIITTISKKWFSEEKYTLYSLFKSEDLNNSQDTEKGRKLWFIEKIKSIVPSFIGCDEDEVEEILNNEDSFNYFREVCRMYIQNRLPNLYREFILRHSVFFRFLQNIRISFIFLIFSISLSLISFLIEINCDFKSKNNLFILILYFLLIIVLIYSTHICKNRPKELRKKMIVNTLEIWYSEVLLFSKKPEKLKDKENKTED